LIIHIKGAIPVPRLTMMLFFLIYWGVISPGSTLHARFAARLSRS
jgi:hypothetical protein